MEEWGIWDENWNKWWSNKTGLLFHTSSRDVVVAQLDHICVSWEAGYGEGLFSIKSFLTGEVYHRRYIKVK